MTPGQRREIIWTPLAIWGGLLLLAAATLGYAYWHDAPAKLATGLLIALAKALLVAVVFMQLNKAAGIVRVAAIAGIVWASFLYLLSFADFLTR
jgi:cytochrome c oxidase subunit 4